MTTPTPESVKALADEVAAIKSGFDNALDVRCEIALFEPCRAYASIRANAAGTKTICTTHDGRDLTFWARDYTISAHARKQTAAALRARAAHLGASHA